ncbi:MAG: hypothetical protein R6X10_18010 [Desulfobacterales bacterium]
MAIRIIMLIVMLLIPGCSGTQGPISAGQPETLDPDYHVITGTYRMEQNWSIDLPTRFNKRIEKDYLVIWRPGFKIQISFSDNNRSEKIEKRLTRIKEKVPSEAFDIQTIHEDEITRFAYRVSEKKEGLISHEFHGFLIGDVSHVEMVFSFERESDFEMARGIWLSVKETI